MNQTRPRSRKWPVLALALILALAAILYMNRDAQDSPDAASRKTAQETVQAPLEFLPSDVLTLAPAPLHQTLLLSGTLRASDRASVKARVGGTVGEVLVREGEPVKAGQVLLRMDRRDYQARVDQAQGALLAARGQVDIARRARDNHQALLARGFISQNAFDTAASQLQIAAANLDSAQAALEVARTSLADTVIAAPMDGTVSNRSVQPGEKVSPDNPLLELVDLRRMELEAAVPSADIGAIRIDQPAQLLVDGLPQALVGKVARINPAADPGSRAITIYIQVENPELHLRDGMFAQARITLTSKPEVLALPAAAIQTQAGNSFVYTIEDGVLTQRPVSTGMSGSNALGTVVEILDGVQPGMLVVRNNLGLLRSGTPAKVVEVR